MAGGKGSRLKPFTEVLPKPLIPLNDKTVVEHIINSFTDNGLKEFYISINFKGKILKAFFEELNSKLIIKFLEENKPLGTAGSLYKLRNKISSTFIVTNCDVIFKFDINDLINFHKESQLDVTLVVSAKQFEIPYGACETDNEGFLKKIIEKPKLDYLINTGLYVFESTVLDYIPKNKFYNMNELIQKLIKDNKKIGVFPINSNAWLDLGQWDEYKNAVKKLK
jgi:NDP-sugar pyrophosphorylase family protein